MKYYLKIILIYVLRSILCCFYIFSVKRNRILFSSYEGLSYTCNPKYIFQDLYDNYTDTLDYIWCLNDKSQLPKKYLKNVTIVKFLSLRHIYYLLTSKIIVSNLGIEPFVPKRKSQLFINTWHGGGAYKKVSSDLSIYSKAQAFYVKTLREIRRKDTDVFLTSSKAFTEVAAKDFHVNTYSFLNTGMPRNDVLINATTDEKNRIREQIAINYKLPIDELWVLYAPTFRGTYRDQQHIDNQIINPTVEKAFSDRFQKKVVILNRAHISKDKSSLELPETCIDLTSYPDMQELLLACDILITDYSSSVWDFSMTGKPGFLFVPDAGEYEKSIGFYTPLDKWSYPYGKSIPELCKLISDFDEQASKNKINSHLDLLGSYEKGTACKQVRELIIRNIET